MPKKVGRSSFVGYSWFHVKFLYICQFVSFILFLSFCYYIHVSIKNIRLKGHELCPPTIVHEPLVENDKFILQQPHLHMTSNVSMLKPVGHHMRHQRRFSKRNFKKKKRRDLRTNRQNPQEDYIRLGPYAKIQRPAMNEICIKIHTSCAERGKKVRGAPGVQGPRGPMGPIGSPGRRGSSGPSGFPGLTGTIGEPGINGRDGLCNCSFPDIIVKKVPVVVSGPPIIQYYPVTVVVPGPPVVVVKEVTVKGADRPMYVTRLVPGPTRIVYRNITRLVPGIDQIITVHEPVTVAGPILEHELTATEPSYPRPPPERTPTDGRPLAYTPIFVRRRTSSRPAVIASGTSVKEEHVTRPQATVTDSILEPIKATTIQKMSTVVNESALITGTATTKKLETTTVLSTTSVSTTTTEPYTGPPTLGRNKRRCRLDIVGTPIHHAESPFGTVGSWMRDSMPNNTEMFNKWWVMDGYVSPVLYEFKDEQDLIRKKQLIKYYMNYLVVGTGAVIYNGSFYYHRYNSPDIVRYDLNAAEENITKLHGMAHLDCPRKSDDTTDENSGFQNCSETERHQYLYDMLHNYADFAVDENGLWVVYRNDQDETILNVAKLDAPTMDVVAEWNITVANMSAMANTFIMCGVLYGLKSGTDYTSEINFAYDLYENRELLVSVEWKNPYNHTTMMDYNPIDKRVYFYDNQNLLSTSLGVKLL